MPALPRTSVYPKFHVSTVPAAAVDTNVSRTRLGTVWCFPLTRGTPEAQHAPQTMAPLLDRPWRVQVQVSALCSRDTCS
jgi:hypothetical protein